MIICLILDYLKHHESRAQFCHNIIQSIFLIGLASIDEYILTKNSLYFRQLMELLNCGKIRWVKAILAHLVRCISGTYINRNNGISSGDEENPINHQVFLERFRRNGNFVPVSLTHTQKPDFQPKYHHIQNSYMSFFIRIFPFPLLIPIQFINCYLILLNVYLKWQISNKLQLKRGYSVWPPHIFTI